MNEIYFNSKWLSFAFAARENRLTIEELKNTKVLDFDLQTYIAGDNEIYTNDINMVISEEEIIKQTRIFIEELKSLKRYEEFDIEHISLSGMNFKNIKLDILYEMKNLKSLILEGNLNCKIELKKLNNIKSMNLIIDENCKTDNIEISDYTRYSMGLPIIANEYDLYLATKRLNFIDNNIDISDISTISYYTCDMPTISIKSMDDIKRIKEMNLDNILIGIRTKEISDIVNLSQLMDYVKEFITRDDKNISFNLVIDNLAEMTVQQLNIIENKISNRENFSKIKILKYIDCYEEYSIEKYKIIKTRIDYLLSDIDVNQGDIEKFLAVQNKIVYNVCFDKLAESPNYDREYFNKNYIISRNLEGGLLQGKCVCAGYSDILRNMLKCVNIEANFVKGKWKEQGHAWNQVKLNDNWYNTDVTAGRYKIIQALENEYCLKSDLLFYSENQYSIDLTDKANMYIKECPKSYNPYYINEYIANNLTNCEHDMVINIIEEIQGITNNKYNIMFLKTSDEKCQIAFVEKSDNELKIYQTQMFIYKDEIAEFVKTYFSKYEGQCRCINCKDNPLTFVSCQEGVGLIMGTTMRNRLFEEGVIDLRTIDEREEYERVKNIPIDMIVYE